MMPGYLSGQLRDRPQIGDYAYRARRYPIAERAIALAEAEHGPPVPTCLCGGRFMRMSGKSTDFVGYRCGSCGQAPP